MDKKLYNCFKIENILYLNDLIFKKYLKLKFLRYFYYDIFSWYFSNSSNKSKNNVFIGSSSFKLSKAGK
jgi:hypothetical protein